MSNIFLSIPKPVGSPLEHLDVSVLDLINATIYNQIQGGSIKLGKLNKNHIIQTTQRVLKESYNIHNLSHMDDKDNFYDFIALYFYLQYKPVLVVSDLNAPLCPDVETLKQLHPEFQPGGCLSHDIDSEIEMLLHMANEMCLVVQIFTPTLQFIVDIMTLNFEKEYKKYVNGSGATVVSRRRFLLFRRFKPVHARRRRSGSEGSVGSMETFESELVELSPVRRKSYTSCSTGLTDTELEHDYNQTWSPDHHLTTGLNMYPELPVLSPYEQTSVHGNGFHIANMSELHKVPAIHPHRRKVMGSRRHASDTRNHAVMYPQMEANKPYVLSVKQPSPLPYLFDSWILDLDPVCSSDNSSEMDVTEHMTDCSSADTTVDHSPIQSPHHLSIIHEDNCYDKELYTSGLQNSSAMVTDIDLLEFVDLFSS